MQNPEILKQLADKNVVVFRGTAKDAIDMQLCKMGIVPYTTGAYDESKQKKGISKKFMDGLASISESIGKPGLEHVAYKWVGGTGEGNRYSFNEQRNRKIEALSQKAFFEFFFAQNPSINEQKAKLLEGAKQYTDDSLEIYTYIGGEEQGETINEIFEILGSDRVYETINIYNEKAILAYEQRHAKFVTKLPEIKKEEVHEYSQQVKSIEETIGIGNLSCIEAVTNHVKQKTKLYCNIGSQVPLSSIVEYAREIETLFERAEDIQSQNKSISKVHGVQHVKNVLLLSNYLGLMNGVSYKDLAIIREAAIYHDCCHERPADPSHAKAGADWYLENVDTTLNKEEVAYLIEAHELNGRSQLEDLAASIFSNITEQRKAELIRCAEVLQDADRLDILRYDIEKTEYQRFQTGRLNNPQSAELISAVIELNTRQAINKGYLQISEGKVHLNEKEKIGEELLAGVIEQSRNVKIRTDEISDVNREINQVEKQTSQQIDDNTIKVVGE